MEFKYSAHLEGPESLITPYKEIRAGFIAIALEKNRKATPFVEEAKALRVIALKAKEPKDLLGFKEIMPSILAASGISDKATNHLKESDKKEAMQGLIDKFLEPAGEDFVDELVYRFLLTRGDSLGGSVRNLAGFLGERKFSRAIISTLALEGKGYQWLHSKSMKWVDKSSDDADIEIHLKGLRWEARGKPRTLIYNLTVPLLKKNVDLCLLDCDTNEVILKGKKHSAHNNPDSYIAVGELKGGIDPAGADEHWKTANSALERIRKAFSKKRMNPSTFFVGAAIEKSMAEEIFRQLRKKTLLNAANLTVEKQVISLCRWLIHL